MAKRASVTYGPDWYTPVAIKNLLATPEGEKIVRKEYTRLRDISQKRLKRLKAAGYESTQQYKRNVLHYPKLKDIKSKTELAYRLSDLSRFIEAKTSTVSGIKETQKKAIETMHEHGYDFINSSNIKQFGEFMEEFRNRQLDMEYDSGDAAELFSVVTKKKVSIEKVKENFEEYLEKYGTDI